MLCPSCGKENGGRFGALCPACQAWMKTRRLPDVVEPKQDSTASTGVILGFVARNTQWLRQACKFFAGVRWSG